MSNKYGKVLLLMGGWSREREISLISGKSVFASLKRSNVDVEALDLNRNNLEEINNYKADRVFNILHGTGGEDGFIQEYLESLSIPYTGSDSLSSKICMDKRTTKDILIKNNLPTPKYINIGKNFNIDALCENLELPLVIKPSSEGSSIGVYIAEKKSQVDTCIEEVRKITPNVIAEEYVDGLEYTVGVLNNRALPVIKLIPPGKFYDFNAKYESSETQYVCPSGLSNDLEHKLQEYAKRCFKILGAKGWGRLDIMLDKESSPWIIELNTIPGMTSHSLVPMAAKQAGIDFDALVLEILDTSFE